MSLIYTRRKFIVGVASTVAALAVAEKLQLLDKLDTYFHQKVLVGEDKIQQRKFPYPYKAALCITSDIVGCSITEFEAIHRFLNTTEDTPIGRGLGLDIGDSFWMFVGTDIDQVIDVGGRGPLDQVSYWRGTQIGEPFQAKAISKYIRCGWIDSIHSYGDFNRSDTSQPVFKREYAEAAIRELEKEDLKIGVWIDHGNEANVQNFAGSDKFTVKYQQGDHPASPYYHTDLLIPYGIRFVWASTWATEELSFSRPTLLYPRILRDGQKVWGFYRHSSKQNHFWQKPKLYWNPYFLPQQLSSNHLEQLKKEGGYASIAQHFGGPSDLYFPFVEDTANALRQLAQEHTSGEILVACTSRILQYNLTEQYLDFTPSRDAAGKILINIQKIKDPHRGPYVPGIEEIRGVTFYCDRPEESVLLLDGKEIEQDLIQINPPDHTGRKSIGIRWFAPDTTDYTRL